MLKMQEVPFPFIIAVMLIILARCSDSSIIKVNEGKVAHLKFSYPCESTKVTLRYGHRRPFYRSSNPEAISLPWNHVFENKNDTVNDKCSLHLTIDPVSRDDAGTYILTAYKNDEMLPEYPRIGLRVKYLPGKASCETSNEFTDGEWVSLQCTAPVGTLPGQIVCYQNGIRLPSLTKPEETYTTLRQTSLARLADPVHCCSCSLEQTMDMCQCKDCRWEPNGKSALTNITDPCPGDSLMQYPMPTPKPRMVSAEATASIPISFIRKAVPHTTPAPKIIWVCVVGGILGVSLLILLVLYIRKVRQAKQLSKMLDEIKKENHLTLIHGERPVQDDKI